ncbi:MAG: hypothetical protein M3P23_12445 [Actinomycetota bacterium]|nr:hypothetical protein [Actinomycetota bacterium]
MAGDFATIVRPQLEAQLEPGETLQGVIAANHQRTFSGVLYAIAVTDRRLVLQPVDRRAQLKGDPRSITPDTLVSADVDGAGGGWWTAPAAILDRSAIALTLRTTDGEKLKLMMMKGGGLLGGGQAQYDGVAALAEWMQRSFGDR